MATKGKQSEQEQETPDSATEGDTGALTKDSTLEEFRAAAAEIWAGNDKLTPALLAKLEPLLYVHIPERFIEHREQPYPQTGVRSIQVQIDRMNAVLGQAHWRALTVHSDGGSLCRATVIVGDNLHLAGLDESGQLDPTRYYTGSATNGEVTHAEIIAERHGWGGWKRGTNPGDIYKSSETNALKRVFARFGPANEVYSQDFEDDPALADQGGYEPQIQTPPPGQPAQQEQPGGGLTEEAAEGEIQKLLAEPGAQPEVLALRAEANQALLGLPQPPSAVLRYQFLAPRAYDTHQLQGLIDRSRATSPAAAAAVQAQAGGGMPGPGAQAAPGQPVRGQ